MESRNQENKTDALIQSFFYDKTIQKVIEIN